MLELKYRERIYGGYVTARRTILAPITVEGLKPRAAYLNRLIEQHFPRNLQCTVLEIGCGHGALIYFAQLKGYLRIEGVDGSAEQVDAAKRLGVKTVRHGDLMTTLATVSDASLDMVVAFDVIEHFNRNELIELVDAVYRVLKPGGKWIIHVPNADSPFFGRILFGDLTHEMAFTRTSISQLLLSSGYKKIDCFEDRPIPHTIKGFIRLVLWHGFRTVLRLYLAAETGNTAKDEIFSQNMLAIALK